MPKRTTPFQAIVHLIRQHYAGPGVTVSESKLMCDPDLGEREVDIVVEAEADGDAIVISYEVNQRSRRASVDWVEQQIDKHRRLPTHKLVLVSRAGFSRTALTRVALEHGRVEALTPEIVMVDGQQVIKRLYADSVNYTPTHYTLGVVRGEEEHVVQARTARRSTARTASTSARLGFSRKRRPRWTPSPGGSLSRPITIPDGNT
ncbi:hypothetical protein Afe04nite_27290 [Asanoa ferruginea]|uniref:hypothetical protein n=1 Tax=Asanoa ferruginea TaxID=53367 RepID=UPI000E25C556|nr:hypothetical protein [Asanoa ferruginea]GIF48190.1 hypothetical protein Afe04nite_27290 [Asanoa ferruginea]